ncbi:hypothetical protein TNCV_263021 [Trichonephila clavipes]|nr:hypothetical protein TNCV_263021 [Trichonephila clavipes]
MLNEDQSIDEVKSASQDELKDVLNLAEWKLILPQLKSLGKNGKSPKKTSKNLILQLLRAIAAAKADVCEF